MVVEKFDLGSGRRDRRMHEILPQIVKSWSGTVKRILHSGKWKEKTAFQETVGARAN